MTGIIDEFAMSRRPVALLIWFVCGSNTAPASAACTETLPFDKRTRSRPRTVPSDNPPAPLARMSDGVNSAEAEIDPLRENSSIRSDCACRLPKFMLPLLVTPMRPPAKTLPVVTVVPAAIRSVPTLELFTIVTAPVSATGVAA